MPNDIDSVLMVLSGTGAREYDASNPLVLRACRLAELNGAALHVVGILDDAASRSSPLISRKIAKDIEFEQLEIERKHLDRLAAQLEARLGVRMQGEAVADAYRADAILRQARKVGADVIIKESRDERFVLGILSNTDWELLRTADVPVWLVSGSKGPEHGVCAAIECQLARTDDGDGERLELDYRVFDFAKRISDLYGGPLYLVHAYQLPTYELFEGYYPMLATDTPSPAVVNQLDENLRQERDSIARQHGEAIRTFVDSQGIPLDDLQIVRGDTAEVVKQQAERREAGLIVMGASHDKGRWQRFLGKVTAERSLHDAPCDIVFMH